MEAAEALELMAGEMSQIDTTFQFWLASTFAMIVAVHTLSDHVEVRIRLVLTVLYVLLSIYSVTKTVGDFQQVIYLSNFAVNAGVEMPNEISSVAAFMRAAIYLLGSVSALVFVWVGPRRAVT